MERAVILVTIFEVPFMPQPKAALAEVSRHMSERYPKQHFHLHNYQINENVWVWFGDCSTADTVENVFIFQKVGW